MTNADTTVDPADRLLVVTRPFDAPRERVFEAWTDPAQVEQWWGPEGFTSTVHEIDVRPGGTFRIDMHAPDGTVYPDSGEFHEVVEPERLVMTSRALEDDDGAYGLEVYNTVTFADHDGKTELTLEAKVVAATPEVTEALKGMEMGWSQSFEKLADTLSTTWGEAA